MNKKLILIILFLMVARQSLSKNPYDKILFNVRGMTLTSTYINDKVVLGDNGTIVFSTIAPTIGSGPNVIGKFEAQITSQEHSQIIKLLERNRKKIPLRKGQPQGASVVEELHFKGEKFYWLSTDRNPVLNEIRKKFKQLAIKAYNKPVSAISLSCKSLKKKVSCMFKNNSKLTVYTVDPLGVSYSISCLDIRGKKKVLHKIDEHDPRKMSPKKIKIDPGQSYEFLINTDKTCDYRIVVNTTDMLINKKYNDLLLGELVSDRLKE